MAAVGSALERHRRGARLPGFARADDAHVGVETEGRQLVDAAAGEGGIVPEEAHPRGEEALGAHAVHVHQPRLRVGQAVGARGAEEGDGVARQAANIRVAIGEELLEIGRVTAELKEGGFAEVAVLQVVRAQTAVRRRHGHQQVGEAEHLIGRRLVAGTVFGQPLVDEGQFVGHLGEKPVGAFDLVAHGQRRESEARVAVVAMSCFAGRSASSGTRGCVSGGRRSTGAAPGERVSRRTCRAGRVV